VKGTGDGRTDTYSVDVTQDMLSRGALSGTPTGSLDAHTYYTSADLDLKGHVSTGDKWTLTIDGVRYDYTVQSTDVDLGSVASGILSAFNAQKPSKAAQAPYTLAVSGEVLSIADANGFWFDLEHEVAAAATVLKSGTLSSTTTFDSATVTLSGTVNVGDVWSLTLTDSSAHTSSYTWLGDGTELALSATNAEKLEYIANQLGSATGALNAFTPDITG